MKAIFGFRKTNPSCLREDRSFSFVESVARRSTLSRAAVLLVLCGLCGAASTVDAQSAYFSGVTSTISSSFEGPFGVAVDAQGDIYVADPYGGTPEGATPQVDVMVFSGGTYQAPVPVPTSTPFVFPVGVAVDASGDVYVTDYAGQVYEIVKGSTNLMPATPVGSGWSAPSGIAIDRSGNVFVVDNGAQTVSKISGNTVVAVNHGPFSYPTGAAVDASGDVYVADQETGGTDGEVFRIAAANFTGTPTPVGPTNLNLPSGVGVDVSGNIWVIESGISTLDEVLASNGSTRVIGNTSGFDTPEGLALEPDGNVILADTNHSAVDKIVTQGVNFGSSPVGSKSASSPITLQFTFSAGATGVAPSVVTQGTTGTDFSIDTTTPGTCQSNGTSHSYLAGDICTVVVDFDPALSGTRYGAVHVSGGTAYVYGTGTGPQITYNLPPNFVPGSKPTLPGTFSNPNGVAVDGSGNVYVADKLDGVVQKISGGSASSIGSGFTTPVSVAVDGAGNVFVADSGADKIFEILAGSGTTSPLASTYTFSNPMAVAVDANGNVYVADAGSGKVVEILAGSQYSVANVLSSGFTSPDGIAVDGVGNLYVADSSTNTVSELAVGSTTPTTISSSFSRPAQVAIDGNGNLFVADSGNNAVKEILAGSTNPFALDSAATFSGPLGVTVDGLGNVYVANSGANQVFELDYADPPALTFVPQEDGTESAAQSVQIVNDGNTAALTNVSPGLSLGTSNYALQGGGSDCSSTFSLSPSASCNVTVEFTPGTGVTGTVTDAVTLTDNNLNASPSVQQTISLTGTAVNLQIALPASTTLPGGTVGVAYGPVTFSAIGGTGTGYTWAATGLPAGLSLDSTTGELFGTPTTVASAVTVTVTATDSGSGSSGVEVQKNYTLTVVAGTVTVNWTPPSSITYGVDLTTVLTATATDGAAVPGTFAYTAKLNPSGTANTVSAATILGVGGYTLTATFAPSDTTDYNTPAPVQVTLTVTSAVLTVTANNATRAYGAADPAFTAAITGFVNGDTQVNATTGAPSLTTTATVTSPVGNYTITAAVGTLTAANYTFTFVNGSLDVTQATLTVTANNATRAYGAANPAFTATITGFLNNDPASVVTGAPAFSTTATITSPVGPYPITPSIGTLAAANYTFAFVNGTLNVTQAALTVTANNATRAYAAADPAFTATITGFLNGDPASVVTGSPAFTTTATATSPVGSYPIAPSLGTLTSTNYAFTFVNGTLTITQAAPAISWAVPAPITYGTPLSATQLDASSTVAGTFVYTPPAGTVLNVGSGQILSVTLTPTDTTNYTSAMATVLINVTAAAPTITFAVPNHTYGDGPFAVTATSNSTGALTYSVISGPATSSGNTVTLSGAGSVALQASEAAAGNYAAGTVQTTIVVAKQASQTVVTTNAASVNAGQSVTLTATVTPAVLGAPTGTVTFFSGTTQLGSPVSLTNATAQLVVSSLSSGANSISATYSGDANFLVSSGSLNGGITIVPLGLTLSASPASQTGPAGSGFAYNVTVTPTGGMYPGTVSFAASGLPSGATAIFTPSTIAANAGQQTIGMAITTASTTSALRSLPTGGKLAPVALALLLLPLAGTRRMRRQGQRFGKLMCLLLLALAGVAATATLTGCGTSGYIKPTTSQKSYTITITATSGGVQQTATVALNLQ